MGDGKLVRDKIPDIIRAEGQLRAAKADDAGGFADRIIWSGNR